MNNKSNSNFGTIIVVIIIVVILVAIFGGSSSSSSYSSYSNSSSKYSNQYNTDSKYRRDVDSVANAYGMDSDEVDRKIQAVAGEMDKNKRK